MRIRIRRAPSAIFAVLLSVPLAAIGVCGALAPLVALAAASFASSGAATCDPGSCPKHCCESK